MSDVLQFTAYGRGEDPVKYAATTITPAQKKIVIGIYRGSIKRWLDVPRADLEALVSKGLVRASVDGDRVWLTESANIAVMDWKKWETELFSATATSSVHQYATKWRNVSPSLTIADDATTGIGIQIQKTGGEFEWSVAFFPAKGATVKKADGKASSLDAAKSAAESAARSMGAKFSMSRAYAAKWRQTTPMSQSVKLGNGVDLTATKRLGEDAVDWVVWVNGVNKAHGTETSGQTAKVAAEDAARRLGART